jgi:tripartite-type tricarboxylate transporter receptor subunit TctC
MQGTRTWVQRVLVLAVTAAFVQPALAQSFPSKPLKLIVPYGPTGLPDALARLTAQKTAEGLGQPIVIENKAGASGIIGAQQAAKSPADGYTLFLTDNNMYAINPAVYPDLPYNPTRDFTPITQAIQGHMFLVANADIGAGSLKDLIAQARAKPGMMYGSPGNATLHHLGMEQLKLVAEVQMTHVPYKGVAQATPALLAGDVAVMFAALASVVSHAKAGKLRILAVGSSQRSALMPDVPTVAEAGYPGFEVGTSMGFAAPAGTPRPAIERLNAEMVKALKSAEVQAKMPALGVEVVANTPEQFAEQIRRDQEHYSRLVKRIGLKVE